MPFRAKSQRLPEPCVLSSMTRTSRRSRECRAHCWLVDLRREDVDRADVPGRAPRAEASASSDVRRAADVPVRERDVEAAFTGAGASGDWRVRRLGLAFPSVVLSAFERVLLVFVSGFSVPACEARRDDVPPAGLRGRFGTS